MNKKTVTLDEAEFEAFWKIVDEAFALIEKKRRRPKCK
jgi:hypothetical protein